jgi:LuxR family maltose regulon positive regulatory protein
LTLVKVRLAQDTPASRGQAAGLLSRLRTFFASIHNSRFLIEALALQALLSAAKGDQAAARTALQQAITLAEPGRFIRLFVDLGPSMARLLDQLGHQGVAAGYVNQILAAFADQKEGRRKTKTEPLSLAPGAPPSLLEPLTPREMDVLALLGQHLTNKEIAEALVISPGTVKTHTLNIYRKLDVHRRQQAVARAKGLNIL